jgi:glutaredoxin
MKSLLRASLSLLVLAAVFTAQAQGVYRWVDKDGKVHYGDSPPSDNKSVEQKNLKAGTGIANPENLPLAVRDAMERNPVSAYLTNCGELCTNARALLAKRGVPYTVRDPENNPADAEALKKLVGNLEVPLLQVGTRTVKGFTEESWNSALDAGGYPRTNVLAKPIEPKKSEMPKDKKFDEPGKPAPKDAPKTAPAK